MMTCQWAIAALLVAAPALTQAPKSSARPVAKEKLTPPVERGTVVAQAHADIAGQGISGSADFVERRDGTATFVEVHLRMTGLKPGLHGVHLHAVGKCEPDFEAAGGHFDPGPASNSDPDANHPFHMADLPQLQAPAAGPATFDIITTRLTLSNGPLSLFDADGSTIVIHANPDREVPGEPGSGVSGGPRIACGVILRR